MYHLKIQIGGENKTLKGTYYAFFNVQSYNVYSVTIPDVHTKHGQSVK